MIRNYRLLAIVFCLSVSYLLTSCGISKQARQASNLANCDFRIRSVENINLGGVNFQYIHSITDLGMADAARIMGGLTSPTFPLSLQLNLEGKNPNAESAGLNRIEWMLFVDDIQMTSGILENPFIIPAKGTSVIPVQVALDLKTVLSGESATALIKFCLNLAGVGNEPTRFKIKLKPSIMVGKTELKYPGYITVKTSYLKQ